MSNPYCIEADIKRLTYQAHEFHTTGNGTTIANEKLKLPRYCISQIYIYTYLLQKLLKRSLLCKIPTAVL